MKLRLKKKVIHTCYSIKEITIFAVRKNIFKPKRETIMKVGDIVHLIDGQVIEGEQYLDREIDRIFASDLMSDVLTIDTDEKLMLLTGLANNQSMRTCEMSDIKNVVFVRGKRITEEMLEIARDNEMVLIQTEYSMYRTAGILYMNELPPVY